MNYITEEIKFRVPQNGGFQYRMYECADQIADLLDMYFDTQIEDISRITDLIDLYFGTAVEDTTNIHNLIEQEIKASKLREVKHNRLEGINGQS